LKESVPITCLLSSNLDRLKISRDDFMDALRLENIGVGVHFRSLHLHPYYRDTFNFKPEDFPVANGISESIISLPLYPKMQEDELLGVVDGVKKVVKYYKK
jgi:dTDP-4-amino-4,6-dideoxygalactose transaminase